MPDAGFETNVRIRRRAGCRSRCPTRCSGGFVFRSVSPLSRRRFAGIGVGFRARVPHQVRSREYSGTYDIAPAPNRCGRDGRGIPSASDESSPGAGREQGRSDRPPARRRSGRAPYGNPPSRPAFPGTFRAIGRVRRHTNHRRCRSPCSRLYRDASLLRSGLAPRPTVVDLAAGSPLQQGFRTPGYPARSSRR